MKKDIYKIDQFLKETKLPNVGDGSHKEYLLKTLLKSKRYAKISKQSLLLRIKDFIMMQKKKFALGGFASAVIIGVLMFIQIAMAPMTAQKVLANAGEKFEDQGRYYYSKSKYILVLPCEQQEGFTAIAPGSYDVSNDPQCSKLQKKITSINYIESWTDSKTGNYRSKVYDKNNKLIDETASIDNKTYINTKILDERGVKYNMDNSLNFEEAEDLSATVEIIKPEEKDVLDAYELMSALANQTSPYAPDQENKYAKLSKSEIFNKLKDNKSIKFYDNQKYNGKSAYRFTVKDKMVTGIVDSNGSNEESYINTEISFYISKDGYKYLGNKYVIKGNGDVDNSSESIIIKDDFSNENSMINTEGLVEMGNGFSIEG